MGRDGIFMLATVLATKWEYVWVYGELFIENFLSYRIKTLHCTRFQIQYMCDCPVLTPILIRAMFRVPMIMEILEVLVQACKSHEIP